jgi:hypothetical protein
MSCHRAFVALPIVAALAAAACGVSDPSTNTIETFTGSVAVGNQGPNHEFRAERTGEILLTVTSLTPAVQAVGVAIGQPVSGICSVIYANPVGQLNQVAVNYPNSSGRFCAYVYDSGLMTETVNYTLRVSRP